MATQTQVSDPRAGRVADASEPDREEQRVAVLQRVFRQIIDNERRVGGEAVKKIAAAFNGEPPNG